jgi:hypothetical protein
MATVLVTGGTGGKLGQTSTDFNQCLLIKSKNAAKFDRFS